MVGLALAGVDLDRAVWGRDRSLAGAPSHAKLQFDDPLILDI